MTHTNGEDTARTPFNTPIPQRQINRSAPVDPTAHRLAEGGSLEMNDRDRAGLNSWFHESFQNQFKHASTWFRADWFPAFFAPIRDRINENFDKAFDSIRAHEETVVKLRAENAILRADMKKEMAQWADRKNREFSEEVRKLRNENVALRDDIQKNCALQAEIIIDAMADRIRKELSDEIMKMQNGIADVKKGFEVTKIVADAARVTEEGFTRLKKELAVEIAKSREEMTRESRAAAKRATAAAAKPTTGGKK